MVHGKHGFFLMNQGFEYNLALIGILLPTLVAGPGEVFRWALPTAAEDPLGPTGACAGIA